MAEVTIQAGAKINIPTRKEIHDEMRGALASWMGEVTRGIKWRRYAAQSTSDGGGAITIGADQDNYIGPGSGMVWLLKRISVTAYDPATQTLALYHGDEAKASAAVLPKIDQRSIYQIEEMIYPGDRLIVAGTIAATTQAWVTVAVKEAPEALAWRL